MKLADIDKIIPSLPAVMNVCGDVKDYFKTRQLTKAILPPMHPIVLYK
jgi:hypothetical protein